MGSAKRPGAGSADTGVDVLVDADWLADRLGDPQLRVIEVDVSAAAYTDGHIPGAVLWNIYQDLKDGDYRLVERGAIEGLVERSGISPDSTVVFYGYAPAMGFWLMRLSGHRDARILNTARATWLDHGRPWTKETGSPPSTTYRLPDEDERIRARSSSVVEAIDDPRRVILDVRSEAEYRGERFWPSGAPQEGGRAGHIPSAVHVSADGLLDADGAFRPVADLRQLYAVLDLSGDAEVIPYCAIGARACTAWFALTHLLGYPHARVYDGSWAEWGRMAQTPVEVS